MQLKDSRNFKKINIRLLNMPKWNGQYCSIELICAVFNYNGQTWDSTDERCKYCEICWSIMIIPCNNEWNKRFELVMHANMIYKSPLLTGLWFVFRTPFNNGRRWRTSFCYHITFNKWHSEFKWNWVIMKIRKWDFLY